MCAVLNVTMWVNIVYKARKWSLIAALWGSDQIPIGILNLRIKLRDQSHPKARDLKSPKLFLLFELENYSVSYTPTANYCNI